MRANMTNLCKTGPSLCSGEARGRCRGISARSVRCLRVLEHCAPRKYGYVPEGRWFRMAVSMASTARSRILLPGEWRSLFYYLNFVKVYFVNFYNSVLELYFLLASSVNVFVSFDY